MVNYQIITVAKDIAFSDEFLQAKRERKLSKLTCDLWRSHFNVSKQSVPGDVIRIEDELTDLAARKAMLLDKKKTIEKEEEDYQKRYKVIE